MILYGFIAIFLAWGAQAATFTDADLDAPGAPAASASSDESLDAPFGVAVSAPIPAASTAQAVPSATEVPASPREIRKVINDNFGYREAWVKIQNPHAEKDSRELPLEITLPFCNAKSVKKLDQYCVLGDGTVSVVNAIRGNRVSVSPVDVGTTQSFYAFSNHIREGSASRMPASAEDKDVVCEASCPQMDSHNPCQASGATKDKAYRELASVLKEKADTDCKLCNLEAVVCDGVVFQSVNLNTRPYSHPQ
jgi:hypothetical protein